MHFLKVREARESPKGRTVYWTPLPRRWISRTACCGGLSGCESKCLSDPVKNNPSPASRIGYWNPVPIRLCNRYILEPNQNADFGASFWCHAWAIGWNNCPLFLRIRRKKHHQRHRTWKIISRLRRCMWTQFGKSNNLCKNASVRFSHSALKAQLGKMRVSEERVNAVITLALMTAVGSLPLTS